MDHRQFDSREAFDTALAREIERFEPDLVVLAGFMRVLTDAFVQRYAGRMMNIHPSLLPSFTGLKTHQQALDAMFQSPPRSGSAWGDLVRAASPHQGPWPRISVWHGTADTTVVPQNATELVKQWADVHGLPSEPTERLVVGGFPRAVWRDKAALPQDIFAAGGR